MRAEDVLPDDVDEARFGDVAVRKGTVGAFLGNVRVWSDGSRDAGERAGAERDLLDAVPALRALGLFDVFEIRDERLRALLATR